MKATFEQNDALIIVDVQNDFCPGGKLALDEGDEVVPENARLISKGARFDIDQYSAFDKTGLVSELVHLNIKRVWVVGLALEVCVKATAVDAAKNDYETILVEEGTRFIDRADAEKAREELREAGVIFK